MTPRVAWWTLALVLCAGGWVPAVETYIRRPSHLTGFMPKAMWMSTPELVKLAGYQAETHTVQTSDGFLLGLHRILPPPDDSGRATSRAHRAHRTPLLVGHGLTSNSEQWVVRTGNMSIIFRLVEDGFDVWLSNYRGSFYSRRHKTLSLKSPKFWDFSWHENGVYDQPALIDYVLGQTGHASLITMGHSMSTVVQLVMLMERPEYARKVRASMLLAPPAYFTHTSGAVRLVDELFKGFPKMKEHLETAFSSKVINDKMPLVDQPAFIWCYLNSSRKRPVPLCPAVMKLVAGLASLPTDHDLLRVMISHFPAGSSIRQVMHFGQSIARGGDFRKYDFGPDKNQQIYGLPEPPAYNLSKVDSPAYLYYGLTDNLVNYKDVEKLGANLPSLRQLYKVPSSEFNHFSFFLGDTGVLELIQQVIDDLNKHV